MEDQVAAINVQGKYFCPLSLRMQKSIWRHIRLKKGFINLEQLSQVPHNNCMLHSSHVYVAFEVFATTKQGGYKLKIPTMLLSEKERTRNRFARTRSEVFAVDKKRMAAKDIIQEEDLDECSNKEVKKAKKKHCKKKKKYQVRNENECNEMDEDLHDNDDDDDDEYEDEYVTNPAAMSKTVTATSTGSSNSSSSPVLAQKIYSALQEDILSLSQDAERNLLPPFTSFRMSEDDNMLHLVHRMRRQCPVLCSEENREKLVFQLLSMLNAK